MNIGALNIWVLFDRSIKTRRYSLLALLALCGLLLPIAGSHAQEDDLEIPDNVLDGTIEPTDRHPGWKTGIFSVSHAGEATYRYSLFTPEGRLGMKPSLTLQYGHRTGNGYMGVGWRLGGLSSVNRCAKTYAFDKLETAGFLKDDDPLCVDGSRIVPNDGVEDYGNARIATDPTSKVVINRISPASQSDIKSIEIWDPSGRIFHYGGSPNGVIASSDFHREGDGELVQGPGRTTSSWLLTKIVDRFGNYISFKYDHLNHGDGAVEVRPAEIRYTGHENLGDGKRWVRFRYGNSRGDPQESYKRGLAFRQSSLLEEIVVGHDDTPNVFRRYKLRYQLSPFTSRSLLASISECEGSNRCRAATQFQYQKSQRLSPEAGLDGTGVKINETTSAIITGDVSFDGADDLIVRGRDHWTVVSNRDGFWNATATDVGNNSVLTPFDFDGDSQLEFIEHSTGGSRRNANRELIKLEVRNRTIRTTDPFVVGVVNHAYSYWKDGRRNLSSCSSASPASTALGDIDGNGVADIVSGCESSWTLSLHDGQYGMYTPEVEFGPSLSVNDARVKIIDIDGDGRSEILFNGETKYLAFGLSASGTFSELESPNLPVKAKRVFIDVNGDGLADSLELGNDEHSLSIRLNTGRGFAAAYEGLDPDDAQAWFGWITDLSHPDGGYIPIQGYSTRDSFDVRVVDINRDGRDDFIMMFDAQEGRFRTYETMVLHISDGRHYRTESIGLPGTATYEVQNDGGIESVRRTGWPTTGVADFDGNGVADFYYVHLRSRELQVRRYLDRIPDLLVNVANGSNGEATVEYRALASPNLTSGVLTTEPNPAYSANGVCEYPQRCINDTTIVALKHSDGLQREISHHYEDGRVDVSGHGWIGFARHYEIDSSTNRVTETHFDNSITKRIWGVGYPEARLPSLVVTAVPEPDRNRFYIYDSKYVYERKSIGEREHIVPRSRQENWREVPKWRPKCAADTPWICELELGPDEAFRTINHDYVFDSSGSLEFAERRANAGGGSVKIRITNDHRPELFLFGLPKDVQVIGTTAGPSFRSATRRTRATYDNNGALERVLVVQPNNLDVTTTFRRNDYGVINAVTSADQAGVSRGGYFSYDQEFLYPTGVENSLGHQQVSKIHPFLGVPVYTRDLLGVVVRRRFDGFGRPISESGPNGEHFIQYDFGGLAGSISGPIEVLSERTDGHREKVVVDSLGRPIRTGVLTSNGWSVSGRRYNRQGLLATVEYPHLESEPAAGSIATLYDALGRPVRTSYPDGGPDDSIDYNRRRVNVSNRSGQSREYFLDGDLRVFRVTDQSAALGNLTLEYDYGPFSNLNKVTNNRGTEWNMKRDAYGRLLALQDPNSGVRRYTYTPFGELNQMFDASNTLILDADYDDIGRVARVWTREEGNTTWTWNDNGHLGSLSTEAGVVNNFEYSGIGRLISETLTTDRGTFRSRFNYDAKGRIETVSYPRVSGPPLTIRNQYDSLGQQTQVINDITGETYWRALNYDENGRLTEEFLADGSTQVTEFHPNFGRITGIKVRDDDGSVWRDQQYEYGYGGRLIKSTDNIDSHQEAYSYDDFGRIQSVSIDGRLSTRYSYDNDGNLLNSDNNTRLFYESPIAPNQLTSIRVRDEVIGIVNSPPALQYDEFGRRTTGPNFESTYTSFDLPKKIETVAGSTSYAYDGFGNRVQKNTPFGSIDYVGDLAEHRRVDGGNESVFRVYAAAGREVATIYRGNSGDSTTVSHLGQLGSVEVVTNADGEIKYQHAYEPFGIQSRTPADGGRLSTESDTTGFTSHEHDQESGFINMGGRIYDPATGNFLTPDPVTSVFSGPLAMNPYSYVLNDPLNATDPTGYMCDDLSFSSCDSSVAGLLIGAAGLLGDLLFGGGGSEITSTSGFDPDLHGRGTPSRPTVATIPEERRPTPNVVDSQGSQGVSALDITEGVADWGAGFFDAIFSYEYARTNLLVALGHRPGPVTSPAEWIVNETEQLLGIDRNFSVRRAIIESSPTRYNYLAAEDSLAYSSGTGTATVVAWVLGRGNVARSPIRVGAAPNINPGYPGLGRTRNCLNCAIATDATFAGRPATAEPFFGRSQELPILERHFGRAFAPVASRAAIESQLGALGPGARGIVAGVRSGTSGHVFNAVVSRQGVVSFFDGQSGRPATFTGFKRLLLLITNP